MSKYVYVAPVESIPHNMDAATLDYVMGLEAAWERTMVESAPERLPRRTARVRKVAHWAILSIATLTAGVAEAAPRDPSQGILLAVIRHELGLGKELSCDGPFELSGELRGCGEMDSTVARALAERREEEREEREEEWENENERWAIKAIREDAEEVGGDPTHEIDRWYARRGYARKNKARKATKRGPTTGKVKPRTEAELQARHRLIAQRALCESDRPEVGGDLMEVIDTTTWNPKAWAEVDFVKGTNLQGVWGHHHAAGAKKWDHLADAHLAEMAAIERAENRPIPEVHGEHLNYLWRQSHTRQQRLTGLLKWVATAKLADLYKAARGEVFENRRLDTVARAIGWPSRPLVQGPWPQVEGHPVVGMTRVYRAQMYGQTVRVVRWPDWSNVYLTKVQLESLMDALYTAIKNIETRPRAIKPPTEAQTRATQALAKAGKLRSALG